MVFARGRIELAPESYLASTGTVTPEPLRGPRPLYEVVKRACRDRPEERFGSLPELCDAWRSARAAAST